MLINEKRAVAYFDILGFKAKIANTPLEKLSSDYEKIITYTNGEYFVENGMIINKDVCHRYIFSDSIFLFAFDDTEASFIDFLAYSWRMMQLFIVSGFPLRGAITYGEIYANTEKNIFLGKAISDCVLLENKQNWIGAIVSDSVIEHYQNAFKKDSVESRILNYLVPKYDVPFKDGTAQNCYVLNWRQNMISEYGIKSIFKNEPYDESAQLKIDNALRFSKSVVDKNTAYFNDEFVPQRYRRLFVGKGNPEGSQMFSNGDEY